MNYAIKIALNPFLDVAKFNSILDFMKQSLGALGSSVKPIDDTAFQKAMSGFVSDTKEGFDTFEDAAKKAKQETDKLGDGLAGASQKGENLGKSLTDRLASFGLAANAIQQLSSSLSQFSSGYVALDTATANMRTLGDEAEEMAPRLRDAAIAMSTDLPFAADKIQTAMFNAMASGVQGGEEGLKKFAEIASKLAVGGGADLEGATAGLGALLNAFGATSNEAAKYADTLFNTVNFGVTSIGELNQYLSGVTPTAAAAGIEFDNVAASLALMTQKGVPTATATTKLNSLLNELIKPSTSLAPALEKAGISMESIKNDELPVTLNKLSKALAETGMSANQAFSSSEAAAAFNVLQGQAGQFASMLDSVANTSGSAENAYNQMSDSVQVKSNQMKAVINAFFVRFNDIFGSGFAMAVDSAQTLAPIVTTLTGMGQLIPESAITGMKNFAITVISQLVPGLIASDVATKKTIINTEALSLANVKSAATMLYSSAMTKAEAAGKLIQASATSFATSAQLSLNASMLANPVGLIIGGVIALGGAFYLLYKYVEPFKNFIDSGIEIGKAALEGIWNVVSALGGTLAEVGLLVWDIFVAPFEIAWGVVSNVGSAIGSLIGGMGLFSDAGNDAKTVIESINNTVSAVVESIQNITNVISATREALGSLVDSGIDILSSALTLDFSGMADAWGSAGASAGDAFSNEYNKKVLEQKWDKTAEEIKKQFENAGKIQLSINASANFDNLLSQYQDVQNEINKLQSKVGPLSPEESSQLDNLKQKAVETSKEIAKIAPESRENIRTAVDASGKLVEVYDINIAKAKEFNKSGKLEKSMSDSVGDYSAALIKQSGILTSQKQYLEQLKKQADATNDPAQKQKLIEKYNEELQKINTNKNALVDSFVEGGKAGLITQKAYAEIAKQLGITNEEAKKMVIAKALEEATKSGELNENQIKKMAIQYGVNEGYIKNLLSGQKQITVETENTKNKALSWADALSEASKKQGEAKGEILKAQLEFNKGLISQEEKDKRILDASNKLKVGKQETAQQQQAYNQLKKQGVDLSILEYKEESKSTKEKKSAYEIAKAKYEKEAAFSKLTKDLGDSDLKLSVLRKGIIVSESALQIEKIAKLKEVKSESEKQFSSYKQVFEIAELQYKTEEKKGKVSEKTLANYDEAKKKLGELQLAVQNSEIAQLDAEITYKINKEKADKEVAEIEKSIAEKQLQYNVKIGLVSETAYLETQIKSKEKQIQSLVSDMNIELDLGNNADAVKIAKITESIQSLKNETRDLNIELTEKYELQRINKIEDSALRQKEITLREIDITYKEEIRKAGDNNDLKAKAYFKYIDAKTEAERQFLRETDDLQKRSLFAFEEMISGLAANLLNSTINPIEESINKLQNKLSELQKSEKEADTKYIEDEEKALIESYKRREIKSDEFEKKITEIERKKADLSKKKNEESSEFAIKMQLGVASSFGEIQKYFSSSAVDSSNKLKTQINANIEEQKKQFELLRSQGIETTFKLEDTFKNTTKIVEEFALNAVGSSVATFSAMIAAGEEVGDAFRKGLLTDLVKQAQQIILVNIPAIYAQFAAWMGPWGYAAATGAIALIYGSLEAAKAELGRKDGEVRINGAGTQTSDDILRFTSRDESIMTAKATLSPYSEELYRWQNKTGGSPIEYFTKVNPKPFNDYASKIISSELNSKTRMSVIKSVSTGTTIEKLSIDELREIRKAIEKGNYTRKINQSMELDISVNDRTLIERVNQNKANKIKRR